MKSQQAAMHNVVEESSIVTSLPGAWISRESSSMVARISMNP